MSHNIMIGKYYPITSKVHQMNPLSKIICVILFILMTFVSTTIELNLFLCGLTLLIMILTNIPLKLYYKSLKSLKLLIIFIIIINLIFKISLENTIVMIIRLCLVVIYTSILTLTTPPTEITYGLEKLFSPLKLIKVPVNQMALSITLALRFIPNIIDQAHKILKSQASRGIDYQNTNLKGKILAIKSMLVPMFILTVKKADDLALSMEIRLYNLHSTRTNFRIHRWKAFDTYLVIIHVLILLVIIKKELLTI